MVWIVLTKEVHQQFIDKITMCVYVLCSVATVPATLGHRSVWCTTPSEVQGSLFYFARVTPQVLEQFPLDATKRKLEILFCCLFNCLNTGAVSEYLRPKCHDFWLIYRHFSQFSMVALLVWQSRRYKCSLSYYGQTLNARFYIKSETYNLL